MLRQWLRPHERPFLLDPPEGTPFQGAGCRGHGGCVTGKVGSGVERDPGWVQEAVSKTTEHPELSSVGGTHAGQACDVLREEEDSTRPDGPTGQRPA